MINHDLESKIHSGVDFEKTILTHHSKTLIVSFVNPYSYKTISRNNKIISSVDYWFSDGALLCLLLNLTRSSKVSRASFDFSSIASNVFQFSSKNNKRIAFIGGQESEINSAIDNIKNIHPNLNVVSQFSGYFDPRNTRHIANEISKSQPDILVVGMGTPAQEEFSIICKDVFTTPCIIFTCGGFITQSAIQSDYYHPLIKKLGLRWLQRAYNFKHVRRRLLLDYPSFTIKYLFDSLTSRIIQLSK